MRTEPERLCVVRPLPVALRTWPVGVTAISEEEAGTYTTEWVDVADGPRAAGLFGAPDSVISIDGEESDTATVTLDLADESGAIIDSLVVAKVEGRASRTAGQVLFSLNDSARRVIAKLRWSIVATGENLSWSASGSLQEFGPAASMRTWRGAIAGRHVPRVSLDSLRVWTLPSFGSVVGNGAETQYTPFVEIPAVKPIGSGLFAVPGVELDTDLGASLGATVELWDGDGDSQDDSDTDQLITSAGVATLASAVEPPPATAPSAEGGEKIELGGIVYGSGSSTSAWQVLNLGAYDEDAYYILSRLGMSCSSGISTVSSISLGSMVLELGDVDQNVVATINIEGSSTQSTASGGKRSGTTSLSRSSCVIPLTYGAPVQYARMKLTWTCSVGLSHPDAYTVGGLASVTKIKSAVAGYKVGYRNAGNTPAVSLTGGSVGLYSQVTPHAKPVESGYLRICMPVITWSSGLTAVTGYFYPPGTSLNGSTVTVNSPTFGQGNITETSGVFEITFDTGTCTLDAYSVIEEFFHEPISAEGLAAEKDASCAKPVIISAGETHRKITRMRYKVAQSTEAAEGSEPTWHGRIIGSRLYKLT